MPKLKVLSGEEVIRIFEKFGFFVLMQKGSHVKLRRTTSLGYKQTLTVPKHDEIDRGTLTAIFKQALRFISEEDLTKYFYEK